MEFFVDFTFFPLVSILAETEEIKSILKDKGIDGETIVEVYPIRVQPARILSHIYSCLGKEIKYLLKSRHYLVYY